MQINLYLLLRADHPKSNEPPLDSFVGVIKCVLVGGRGGAWNGVRGDFLDIIGQKSECFQVQAVYMLRSCGFSFLIWDRYSVGSFKTVGKFPEGLNFNCLFLKLSQFIRNEGPRHTRDWEPVSNTLQALSLVEKAEPVQVRFTLRLRDQWSMWMQDGCEVCMTSYIASNGSCFMVTRTIFKNHLLEVGLTQNRATMPLKMLTTVDIFNFYIMCEDPHDWKFIGIAFDWGPGHIWLHITLEGMWPHALYDFGGVLGRPLDTFFWALTISWSRLLTRVWSGTSGRFSPVVAL
jgi:hypothetical protein